MGMKEYEKYKELYDAGHRRPLGEGKANADIVNPRQLIDEGPSMNASPEEVQQMQQEYDQSMRMPAPSAALAGNSNRQPAQQSALDSYAEPSGSTQGSVLDQYAEPSGSAQAPTPEPSMAKSMAQTAADWAPATLGLAGGIVGSAIPGAGTIIGAALGGAAGAGYRNLIESTILGKQPATNEQMLSSAGKAALEEGTGAAIGMGIAKGVGKLAASELGSRIANVAEAPLRYVQDAVQAVRDKIEEPLTSFIARRVTPLSQEASGDAVKQLFKQNIKDKYGPFVQAYSDLDAVSKIIPLKDEARRTFTQELKAWALDDLTSDNYKVIKKFADEIDAAPTGRKIDSIIKQMNDYRGMALDRGAHDQAGIIKELRDRTADFLEDQTTKLAARVNVGKATPEEKAFLTQIAKQRGVFPDEVDKYAKSLTKDYLNAKDKIRTDYAGFRDFLLDVGVQTGVKAKKLGPMTFLNSIDDIPSEKLVEKMFDPRNAAALRAMQKETPAVFDQVVKSKMTQLVQKSSPLGDLDLMALRKNVMALPAGTRAMVISPAEMKLMNSVVDNPRLQRLSTLKKLSDNVITKTAVGLVELSHIAGEKAVGGINSVMNSANPAVATGARQAVGKMIGNPLVNAFSPPKPIEPAP